jgi:hypothetical protein
MSAALRNVGEYRGPFIDYALIEKKNESGFGGLSLKVQIQAAEVWMTPEGGTDPQWLDCSAWDGHGEGYLVLISKAGKVNEGQIQRLIKFAGWDGDFQSMADRTWVPEPVRFDIAEDNYNNQISYRINWINQFDSEPGGGGNVDADEAKRLMSQYGPAIRAIAANAKQKPAPAAGKPATPAAPSGGRKPPQRRQPPASPANATAAPVAPSQDGGDDSGDGLPF